MPRKSYDTNAIQNNWFLSDWMKALNLSQAKLDRLTGWGKARTNDIYHGRTDFYRQILNEAATAMNIEPYELLMHPDDAMKLRSLRNTALSIAAENRSDFTPQPKFGILNGPDKKAG